MLERDIEAVEKLIDSLLPLPSVPQDMSVKDYELYIKLAQVFNTMANALRSAIAPLPNDAAFRITRHMHSHNAALCVVNHADLDRLEMALDTALRPATPAKPDFENKTGYNAGIYGALSKELIGPVEQEKLHKAQPWVRSLVYDLVKRIYQYRVSLRPETAQSGTAKVPEETVLVRLPITDAMSKRGLAVMRQSPMSEGGVNSVFLAMLAAAPSQSGNDNEPGGASG